MRGAIPPLPNTPSAVVLSLKSTKFYSEYLKGRGLLGILELVER
jgi:hypothetical protein